VGKDEGTRWRPFEEARAFAQDLRFKSQGQWYAWAKTDERPPDIPYNPGEIYTAHGWAGWGDWLGTGYVANRKRLYRSFEEARAYARNLGLKNGAAWVAWAKSDARPPDIPANPAGHYRDKGWAGMATGSALGTRCAAHARAALAAGWHLYHSRGGHSVWRTAEGRKVLTGSGTPSDTDTIHIVRRLLRRAGLAV
jgi:hypothetical protein